MRVQAVVMAGFIGMTHSLFLAMPDPSPAGEFGFKSGGSDWYSPQYDCRERPVECTPAMLGDTFVGLPTLNNDNNAVLSGAGIPFPGGSDRTVVATNNSALTRSRAYVVYDHITGALRASGANAAAGTTLDRAVLGLEYALADNAISLEVRVPVGAQRQLSSNDLLIEGGGELGNVSLISKFQLNRTSMAASSAGVAVTLPSADDVTGTIGGDPFRIDNKTILVSPYLAFATAPNENWFTQGFGQVDIAVKESDFVSATGQRGVVENQTLLRLSVGTGYWFFRKDADDCCMFRGLAGLAELHYTTPLEDQDSLLFTQAGLTQFLRNSANRDDVVNISSGFHMEFPCADARVGVNVPVRQSQRFHDTTLTVQLNFAL